MDTAGSVAATICDICDADDRQTCGCCRACDTPLIERCAACGCCRCFSHPNCVRPALHTSLNIPDTVEVHDKDGWVHGTFPQRELKRAEHLMDLLNRQDPEGTYTWTRIR